LDGASPTPVAGYGIMAASIAVLNSLSCARRGSGRRPGAGEG
jgi:hypothetical protein